MRKIMSNKLTDMIKNILPAMKQKSIDYMSLNRLRLNLSTDTTLPENIPYERQTRQAADKVKELLDSRNITFDSPKIIVNPFGLTPLCALVIFHTDEPCGVTYTVKGRTPSSDWKLSYDSMESAHAVPIFGLYPNTDNNVELSLTDPEQNMTKSNMLSIKTEKCEPGHVLSVTDNENTVRYVLELPAASHSLEDVQIQNGGHLLVRDKRICTPTESAPLPTLLYETDLLGRVFRTCYVGSGIASFSGGTDEDNHPIIETVKNDGSSLFTALDLNTGALLHSGGILTGPGRILQKSENTLHFPFLTALTKEHLSVFESLPAGRGIVTAFDEIPFATTGWLREPVPYKGASIETSSAVDYSVLHEKYNMDFSISGDTLLIYTTGNILQEVVFSKSDRIYQLDLTTPMLPTEQERYTIAIPFTEMYSGTYSIVVRFRDGGQEALANTITLSRTRK